VLFHDLSFFCSQVLIKIMGVKALSEHFGTGGNKTVLGMGRKGGNKTVLGMGRKGE